MNKRSALFLIGCVLSGGGRASVGGPIAAWGDSLTPKLVSELRKITPRTVFNGGISGDTSAQVLTRQKAIPEMRDWISIFWYGRNDYGRSDQIKADMAESVALLAPGNDQFVILSILNSANPHESLGKVGYLAIQRINADLASLYPDNFIDVRKHLVEHHNPQSPQDVADFRNDVVPTSLRYDLLHLNDEGSRLVAREVLRFINVRGW